MSVLSLNVCIVIKCLYCHRLIVLSSDVCIIFHETLVICWSTSERHPDLYILYKLMYIWSTHSLDLIDIPIYCHILGWRSPIDQGMTIQAWNDYTDILWQYRHLMTIQSTYDNTDIKYYTIIQWQYRHKMTIQ